MEEINNSFWDEIQDCHPDIIKAITDLTIKSYISVTNMNTRITWWSEKARNFFGLKENYTSVGKEKPVLTMHPDDKLSYRNAFYEKLSGINIEQPVEYRIHTKSGHYDKMTATCRLVNSRDGKTSFLITHYENHGIDDDVDAITGLYKEKVFVNDLNSCMKYNIPAAVLKIGLDSFGRLNVFYGAEYSDNILNVVSQILTANKTENGYVYRMQGAKFVIVVKDAGYEDISRIYNNVAHTLASKIEINGKRVPLKIAGGAVFLEPEMKDANTVRSMLTYALNRSRYNKHGNLVVYNDDTGESRSERLRLVGMIHQDAIDARSGFYLSYQPIVDVKTGKTKGAEALIRWRRDPYGEVFPGTFIEWLEEDACIFELGNWVLATALRDCKKMCENDPDFFVHVNVCPAQLERSEFRETLKSILDKSGVEPSHLCIELTERCRMLDVEFLRAEVEYFKKLGIKVALDDFGTGSSSLGLVLNLPIDEVKIDMSFIRGITEKPLNQEMVRAVLAFANSTGIETCIEGIENEEIKTHLSGYGATWFQGYYYSKPVPFDDFMGMVFA